MQAFPLLGRHRAHDVDDPEGEGRQREQARGLGDQPPRPLLRDDGAHALPVVHGVHRRSLPGPRRSPRVQDAPVTVVRAPSCRTGTTPTHAAHGSGRNPGRMKPSAPTPLPAPAPVHTVTPLPNQISRQVASGGYLESYALGVTLLALAALAVTLWVTAAVLRRRRGRRLLPRVPRWSANA